MSIEVQLTDLTEMHPQLLWEEIVYATTSVLCTTDSQQNIRFELAVENLLGFGTDTMPFAIDVGDIPPNQINRIQRTYDSARLVELAAIAIAGLGLYHGGNHEIRDVALRGSGADYLVNEANHLLEVAGRSRRCDVEAAWENRWRRLSESVGDGFYLCVVEFETNTDRLAFAL